MNTILWVIWGSACICLAAWHVRSVKANNATYRERNQIIAAMDASGWLNHLQRQYGLVGYQDHFRERFWGRDAFNLYPKQLQEVIRAYRGESA